MLGGVTPIVTVLGAAPPADAEIGRLKSFVRAATEIGLHLLLIEPGGKKPVDMRSPAKRRTDDGAAQDAARALGRPDWDRVKSKGGVFLATNEAIWLERYIVAYRKRYGETAPVNFGVAVGPSKLIVVDCDTAAQVDAFLDDLAASVDIRREDMAEIPPTVRTPGQRDAEGNWAHADGGHFYFTYDGSLPNWTGSLTMPGEYVILWSDRYVLIPPSVRPEGPYRLTGQDHPVPEFIFERIERTVDARMHRMFDRDEGGELATAVDQWAETVDWSDILAPAGWVLTARQDNCGCDVWTAPGDHASPKSATAHDTGCTLGRYTETNAPLHIWTDNPGPELEAWMGSHGGSKTLSRLQVVAALDYGGNVGTAMSALSVSPSGGGEGLKFGAELGREIGVSAANLDTPLPEPEVSPPDPFRSAGQLPDEDETAPPAEQDTAPIAGVPLIMPFSFWRDYPPPEFIIDGILEHRGLTAMIGQPGVGKSGIVLDMAARIATGKRWLGRAVMQVPTIYLPGEGLSGAAQRLREWEAAHDIDLGDDQLFMGDSIIQVAASTEAWTAVVDRMIEVQAGLLVIDTFARAAVGLEENSATDVGRAIARFAQVQRATGGGILVVHHTRKDGNSGRGSSALNGALDTELLVREGSWWDLDADGPPPGRVLEVEVTKQKNAPLPDAPLPMLSIPHGRSFIMTGPSGEVDDPLDTFVSVRASIPEPVVSVAIRLQEFAQRFTTQGLTRTELAYGVPMDDHTAARRDAKTAWRMKVNEAVDLGLRYSLLQTLTGAVSGARYVPDATTPEQARQRWAAENMAD